MKEINPIFPLPLSHYIISFFSINILWMVGGNYLTRELLFLTQSCVNACSPLLIYLIQHANFLLLLILLILFIRIVHRTSVLSFISNHSRFNVKGLLLGLGVWLIAMMLNSCINVFFFGQNPTIVHNNDTYVHILMFIFAIVCSPIQAFGEEVLFRSFFYRALKDKLTNKYIVATISALFFTLAHSFNAELSLFSSPFFVLLYYFLSGFFFMLLIYHFEGIEVALGAHIMNNFYISTIMNYRQSSIISHPFFIITKTNIYVDLIILTLVSLFLLCFPVTKRRERIEP
jgi:membrane protease YdiL (CAAX protease family)